MKKIIYLILGIAFLVLSLPPVNWGFLVFAAFAPLFLAARESKFIPNLIYGFIAGLAYFSMLFYWVALYKPPGAALVIGGFALYFAFYLAVTGYFLSRSQDSWFEWLFPGAFWIALKWGISFWKPAFVGIYITDNLGPELRQSLYLFGENGLELFIFLVNGWIFNFVRVPKALRGHMIQLLILGILLLGMNSFARSRLNEKISSDIPVALVQANLPYDVKWREANYGRIKEVYSRLTRQAARSNPKLIVWPQYAFPEDLRVTPNPASRLAAELKTPILLGTYVKSQSGAPIDVALYFDAEGALSGQYAATFLPPLRSIGQKKGESPGIFETSVGRIGVLLCFEDTHPFLSRNLVKEGAQIIVVLCNNQVFGRTTCPGLHADRDVNLAIETDRFFIRSTPTGFSQIIDPHGRVLMSTPLFQETLLIGKVALRSGTGPFAVTGDLISYLAFAVLGVLAARFRRKIPLQ